MPAATLVGGGGTWSHGYRSEGWLRRESLKNQFSELMMANDFWQYVSWFPAPDLRLDERTARKYSAAGIVFELVCTRVNGLREGES